MDANGLNKEELENAARDLESQGEFEFEELKSALERCYKYNLDLGEDEIMAWNNARDMVAEAIVYAKMRGFVLSGMVDYMLFSNHHRVQSGLRF